GEYLVEYFAFDNTPNAEPDNISPTCTLSNNIMKMNSTMKTGPTLAAIALLIAAMASAQDMKAEPKPAGSQRLPKPDPQFNGKIGETYKDSSPDYPQPIKPPAGAPNVLLILLDDVGFGMCST